MEPYDELGVAPTATTAEIRRAYVRLAREFHPDHRAVGDGAAVESDRMAAINAAWTLLSDERRRAAYDAVRTGNRSAPDSGATIRDAGDTWMPLDDDDTIDPRLLDDTPTGARTVPRLVVMLPAALLAAGAGVMMLGLVVNVGTMIGLGMALVVAAGVSFIAIPVVTMMNASRAERDW